MAPQTLVGCFEAQPSDKELPQLFRLLGRLKWRRQGGLVERQELGRMNQHTPHFFIVLYYCTRPRAPSWLGAAVGDSGCTQRMRPYSSFIRTRNKRHRLVWYIAIKTKYPFSKRLLDQRRGLKKRPQTRDHKFIKSAQGTVRRH